MAAKKKAEAKDVGRPLIIPTPEEMQLRVDAYFALCEEQERPATVTGLALALGLCGRKVLDDYQARPEFSDIVRKARTRVEMAYEERLSAQACTGAIFALKNMGWRDSQQLEHTGKDGEALTIGVTFHDAPKR